MIATSARIFRGNTAILATSAILALCAIPATPQAPAADPGDPPSRVARLAYVQGNVSLEPAGVDSFSQAEVNYSLTSGDRVYADLQALAELQTAGLTVRMTNGADLTLASLTDQVAQLGLAQGSIRVATHDLAAPDGTAGAVEIDTPNGTVLVQAAGDIRIDSYPQDDTTVVTVSSGQVEIDAADFSQVLTADQSIRLSGANPVTAQFVALLPPDELDNFDQQRESQFQAAVTADNQYVSPDTVGAEDLDQYGDWAASPDYGEIWYPRAVAVGWIPYHNGHWAWCHPWGWTWVASEPWGFAPFHYGRWANFGNPDSPHWGWIPGPPPAVLGRRIRPIYSPALVAFVGGPAGSGVAAWFPLGPGEAYVPWYHASPAYVNRVNVTNLYTRNATELRSTYANRTTNLYAANGNYTNRPVATTAVNERDFAGGRSVQSLRLDGATRAQLNQAPVLPHPLVSPAASIAAPSAPARAVPPTQARPVLASRGPVGRPTSQPPAEMNPVHPPMTGPITVGRPENPAAAPSAPASSLPRQRSPQSQSEASAPVAARSPEQPRPLINRAEPQPVQPSFEQQRQAIEHADPGRPLGPQQVENMRNGRPAGQPSQPEPAPHPAPRPAPPPAPRPAPSRPPRP